MNNKIVSGKVQSKHFNTFFNGPNIIRVSEQMEETTQKRARELTEELVEHIKVYACTYINHFHACSHTLVQTILLILVKEQ